MHFFADAGVSWKGLLLWRHVFSAGRVRLLLPVSVVPQYVNKCNKRRGGWVGGWMDDLAFYWYRFALCMYYVYGCLTSYLIMRLGSRALVVVRCAFFRASLVPFPIPLQLRAGCSGGDYATSAGVSVVEKRSILGGRLTFLQYWNLSGNLLAAM